jgi:hypothetical protein
MDTYHYELYRKCKKKIDRALSNQDNDLRILVGHSNMLQSLMQAETLQCNQESCYDADISWNYGRYDDNGWEGPDPYSTADSDLITSTEHIEYSFPLSQDNSLAGKQLSSAEENNVYRGQHSVPGIIRDYSLAPSLAYAA